MNIGFHGHAQTIVQFFAVDGIYNEIALVAGIPLFEQAVARAMETKGKILVLILI